MKANARRFNLFLTSLATLTALTVFCGCQTNKKEKDLGALRIHIETPAVTNMSQTISVLRTDPVLLTITQDAFLTEANILAARVIDTPGGFAIQVQFDESGSLTLEQFSASNPGKHFAIFGQWGDKLANGRWLAAPLITRRIAGGMFSFTPDMSREEADRLVLGLNNVAKNIRKGLLK